MKKVLPLIAVALVGGGLLLAQDGDLLLQVKQWCCTWKCPLQAEQTPEAKISALKAEIVKLDAAVPGMVNKLARLKNDKIKPLEAEVARTEPEFKALEKSLVEL